MAIPVHIQSIFRESWVGSWITNAARQANNKEANNEENGQNEHFVGYQQHTNETEEMFIIMLRIKVDELKAANNTE